MMLRAANRSRSPAMSSGSTSRTSFFRQCTPRGAFQVHHKLDGHFMMPGEHHWQTICNWPRTQTCSVELRCAIRDRPGSEACPPRSECLLPEWRQCASCNKNNSTCRHRGTSHTTRRRQFALAEAHGTNNDHAILHRWDPLQECLLVPHLLLQISLHIIRTHHPVVPQEDPCRLTLSKPVHRDLLPWQCVPTHRTRWVGRLPCSRPASCRCALEFESVPTNVAASMCTGSPREPAAAPLFAILTFFKKIFSSNANGTAGTWFVTSVGNGSLISGGLLH